MLTHGTSRRASFSRHLAIPVPVGNFVGAALAFHYTWLTLAEKLGGAFQLLMSIGAVACVLATAAGGGLLLRRLRVLRGLERGDVASSPETLAQAAVEASSAADATF